MHSMDNTPKIVTIIGLIFEGLGVLGSFVGGLMLSNIENSPFYDLLVMDTTPSELDEVIELMTWMGGLVYGLAIFTGIFFIVNVYLFVKLMSGKFEEETAKKVYLYQAIWGGVNILFNQITGILYLVSGVTGYSGHKEEKNVRDGI